MAGNYTNLTGELLKITQDAPSDSELETIKQDYINITGNLRVNPDWIKCVKYDGAIIFEFEEENEENESAKQFFSIDGHFVFDTGIIFKDLLDELSSYFNEWTITVTIRNTSTGELWEEVPIVTFIENNSESYKIMTNNNFNDVDYDAKEFALYNYLYEGEGISLKYNDKTDKKVIAYKKYIDRFGSLQETPFSGKLSLQRTFSKDKEGYFPYPSGDIVIRSPQGSLYDTFLESIIISTSEVYNGQAYQRT